MNKSNLSKLASYYLEVLSHDESAEPSAFAKNMYGNPGYVELPFFPGLTSNIESEDLTEYGRSARSYWNGKKKQEARQVPIIGFPLYAQYHEAKKSGWRGFFIKPLFIFEVDEDNVEELIIPEPEFPLLNRNVIAQITGMGKREVMEISLDLIEDLGMSDYKNMPDPRDFLSKLQSKRPNWPWEEELDLDNIRMDPSLQEVKKSGLYNRAVFLVMERSPYTKGLETELQQLRNMSEHTVDGTVLGLFTDGNSPNKNNDSDETSEKNLPKIENLLEVVPFNTEQEQAVRSAMSEDLTVLTGPPGTGKSQVVTGIVVNALWNGQKVLVASKNNKAVDVVEERINNIAEYPALFRLGSNEVHQHLSAYLNKVLAAKISNEDKAAFHSHQDAYNELRSEIEGLYNKLNELVKERNRLDDISRQIEPLRSKYSKERLHDIMKLDPSAARSAITEMEYYLNRADKTAQGIFVKLFWSIVSKKRFSYLSKCLHTNAATFGVLTEQTYSKNELGEVDIQPLRDVLVKAKDTASDLELLHAYYHQLRKIDEDDSIEHLYSKEWELKNKAFFASRRLWEAWLQLLPERLEPDARKKLGQFNSVLKMFMDDSMSGAHKAKLYSRYYQLSEEIAPYLSGWAITSLSAKGRIPLRPSFFDIVIIDEASQCDIASAIPLLYRAKRAVIIGDPNQLRHISVVPGRLDHQLMNKYELFDTPEWGYSVNSLYDLAASNVAPGNLIQLRDHHRSRAEIIGFSNNFFYDGNLRIATDYRKLVQLPADENNSRAVRWRHISGNTIRPSEGGAVNRAEAQKVVEELEKLIRSSGEDFEGTIGVVTPFRAHANLIRELFSKVDIPSYKLNKLDFMAETVHRFQGDERDVIVFSPVVSEGAPDTALRFLDMNRHLFNVAITRARSLLLVVGNFDYALGLPRENILRSFADYVSRLEDMQPIQEASPEPPDTPEYPTVASPELVSDWEKYFYKSLYNAGVRPIPQYQVDQYLLDFAVIDGERKLAIEVDGEYYHKNWSGELLIRDRLRNMRLLELGWDVMRFWVYQIRDEEDVCVKRVLDWIHNP